MHHNDCHLFDLVIPCFFVWQRRPMASSVSTCADDLDLFDLKMRPDNVQYEWNLPIRERNEWKRRMEPKDSLVVTSHATLIRRHATKWELEIEQMDITKSNSAPAMHYEHYEWKASDDVQLRETMIRTMWASFLKNKWPETRVSCTTTWTLTEPNTTFPTPPVQHVQTLAEATGVSGKAIMQMVMQAEIMRQIAYDKKKESAIVTPLGVRRGGPIDVYLLSSHDTIQFTFPIVL